eukprot:CAMPEP_0202867064 /NCGR_PEP_ID=MMETSP1391-20130828/8594_1 /ASSEMBLY_ACC=CAM_ASM_000867 /TAXON_ID=1034604 /ORGANISM="Chlamydomonas leiostraca, Strain SAG 11-49" /LENGTH=333 /DNA_ID=CAMNT_0049547069 /DNA_START=39 /DNA_END=1040 /DNA_ORIENTATION=+
MALSGVVLRGLGLLTKANAAAASVGTWQHAGRTMASDATPQKKDIVHFLDNRDDPEVDAAIRAYMKAAYKSKAAPEKPEPSYELASKVERKYVAAQVVESGVQNISVPLAYKNEGVASVKRYVAQLLNLGAKAGFEDPLKEVEKRLAEKAASSETAKELVNAIKPYASPDFHAALLEALAAAEAETGAPVVLDGASKGYKAFADKVKKVAEAQKLPWKLLLDAKKPSGDEAARDKVKKDFAAWVQSARVADATAELEVLKAEATAVLDRHLSKSADQIRTEQAAAMAALQRKIESAKGAPWAEAFKKDLEALAAYDAAVASDPANGPKVAVKA